MRLRKPLVLCVLTALLIGGATLAVLHRRPGVSVSAATRDPETLPLDSQDQAPSALATYTEPEPREVKPPAPPASREEFAAQRRAIKLELPHVSPRDYARLRQFCPADFNRDDTVDESDLAAYMERWQVGDGVTVHLADMNRDQVLDSSDVNDFLSAYFNNDCDTLQQKARRATAPPDRVRRIARGDGESRRMLNQRPRSPAAR